MIYPKLGKAENPFLGKAIEELPLEKEETAWDFYRFAVPLPTLGEEHGGEGWTLHKYATFVLLCKRWCFCLCHLSAERDAPLPASLTNLIYFYEKAYLADSSGYALCPRGSRA